MPIDRPETTVSAFAAVSALQRLADRHGADAEGLGQALDGHELSRGDPAVENQARHLIVDAVLQRFARPAAQPRMRRFSVGSP